MSIIRFIDEAKESIIEVEVEPDETVMSLAVNNMVDGIIGECGGAMACATCHCYLDEAYADQFSEVSEMEDEMLSMVEHRQANSRLACQLELTDETGDIDIRLPPRAF